MDEQRSSLWFIPAWVKARRNATTEKLAMYGLFVPYAIYKAPHTLFSESFNKCVSGCEEVHAGMAIGWKGSEAFNFGGLPSETWCCWVKIKGMKTPLLPRDLPWDQPKSQPYFEHWARRDGAGAPCHCSPFALLQQWDEDEPYKPKGACGRKCQHQRGFGFRVISLVVTAASASCSGGVLG